MGKNFARLAFAGAAIFLILLAVLHVLEPEFDPSWRMISEYELGAYGGMMQIAFFSWGLGFIALAVALRPFMKNTGGRLGLILLAAAGMMDIGAGIFITDPITAPANAGTTAGLLHSVCGMSFIFGLPVVATLICWGLAHDAAVIAERRQLIFITALPWLGLLAFFGAIIIFAPSVNGYGPEALIGWPNRFMVVAYTAWLMIVAGFIGWPEKQPVG